MRMLQTCVVPSALTCLLLSLSIAAGAALAKPPISYPHPLITEVLYAVPTGDEGDADKDGDRSATGDEFVELYNPHDRPIQLKGYTVCDGTPVEAFEKKSTSGKGSNGKSSGSQNRGKSNGKAEKNPDSKSQKDADSKEDASGKKDGPKTSLRFVFPDFELKPGEVVVLFNGYEQKIPGPVGTKDRAPASKNEKFGNAWVFTMSVESRFVAFNNKGDCVAINDQSGATIEVVTWGKPSKEPPSGALLTEKAPEAKGSVQRVGLTSKLVEHEEMTWSKGGGRELFSPGVFDPSFTPVPRGTGTSGKDAAEPKSKPAKSKSPTDSPADPTKK